jgi:hypothetical protein
MALERISSDRSWSPSDLAILASCTESDLIDWINSEPENLNKKIRHGLLFFRDVSGDERYRLIADKAINVLRIIGSQSELNRIRVESMYKIKMSQHEVVVANDCHE